MLVIKNEKVFKKNTNKRRVCGCTGIYFKFPYIKYIHKDKYILYSVKFVYIINIFSTIYIKKYFEKFIYNINLFSTIFIYKEIL